MSVAGSTIICLNNARPPIEECGDTLSLYDQQATFGSLKVERPSLANMHSQVLQNVAVRLDLAFKAFFRRVKAGEKESGFPRFRGYRPLDGTVKTCCVRRTSAGKWFVSFSCEVEDAPLPATDPVVGIDVGLEKFATLSTGAQIANPRFFRRDERDLARAQRRLSKEPRTEKGQRATPARRKRRKAVTRIHERIANRRGLCPPRASEGYQ